MKEVAEKVGKRIRYFRMTKGLSQEKLALEAGINPSFLGHLERGLKSPTVDTLAKITNALGITLSQLMIFDDNTENNEHAIKRITAELGKLSHDNAEKIADIVSEIISLM